MQRYIQLAIEQAEARALATTGPHGINVVPVSVAEVVGEEVYLFDFFMRKTVDNILVQPEVALVCWKGFGGVQIKAVASYEKEGPAYEGEVLKMSNLFPDRKLRAVIRLKPWAVYDVAPEADPGDLLIKKA